MLGMAQGVDACDTNLSSHVEHSRRALRWQRLGPRRPAPARTGHMGWGLESKARPPEQPALAARSDQVGSGRPPLPLGFAEGQEGLGTSATDRCRGQPRSCHLRVAGIAFEHVGASAALGRNNINRGVATSPS